MRSVTKPNTRYEEDEIDLLPFVHALWKNKITIIAATLIGVAIAFAAFYASPPKWIASTYIAKPSLLSLYNEVRNTETPLVSEQASEIRLYNLIQDDVFNTAMGIMTANGVETAGTRQPLVYRVSFMANTQAQAESQLKAVLDAANTQALSLNLPNLPADKSLRAFNSLSDLNTLNFKNSKRYLVSGLFIGFMFGCLLALIPVFKLFFERAHNK